jgi:RimJ/RimL family protein N-acetyltransferase
VRAPETLSVETRRLCLRPVRAADAARTAELVTPDVSDNLLTWPWPMSRAAAAERIRVAQARLRARRAVNFAIIAKDDGQLVGWMGLTLEADGSARLGYWLGSQYRNRGLTREAARSAIPPAADYLGIDEVIAEVFERNAASIAVLEALGFRRLGPCEILVPRTQRAEQGWRYALRVDPARPPSAPKGA